MSFKPSSNTAVAAAGTGKIEVHVGTLAQLFNAMDPSPFEERDLDPRVEEFIVSWAREAARGEPLSLTVRIDQAEADMAEPLGDAINEFFRERAEMSRRRLRNLFRLGRVSLLVGLLVLSLAFGLVGLLGSRFAGVRFAELLREGVLIGGWVAMWRPLEIFLYEWWPIRLDMRLYDRLGEMPVHIAIGPQ